MAKVLLTGATGLLGSRLSKDLTARGADVVALVRDRVHLSKFDPYGVDMVHGELTDYALIERTINEYEIDTVIHLGAQTIVGTANRSPLSTFESNIKGTWNILEAARMSSLAPFHS